MLLLALTFAFCSSNIKQQIVSTASVVRIRIGRSSDSGERKNVELFHLSVLYCADTHFLIREKLDRFWKISALLLIHKKITIEELSQFYHYHSSSILFRLGSI